MESSPSNELRVMQSPIAGFPQRDREPLAPNENGGIRVNGDGTCTAKWPFDNIPVNVKYSPSYYTYYGGDGTKKTLLLPYPKPIVLPPPPSQTPINPHIMMESCVSKVVMGGIMGGVMGAVLGVFLGAMGDVSPIQVVKGREVPMGPAREQLRASFKATAAKSVGWLKTFGVMSALFGGVECVIEKQRAKHDIWNPVVSGCVVGATLAAKGGPGAACFGCAGFAGFSFVVDKIMGTH